MTGWLQAIVAVLALFGFGFVVYVGWLASRGCRLQPVSTDAYPERRTVIVNLLGDDMQAIRGVLWATTQEHLVLKGAELLADKMTPTKVDGDLVVFRSRVAWLQVLPGPA